MKNFNFTEIDDAVRKEIVRLVNRKNELKDIHAGLMKDLETVKGLCNTYGSDASRSNVYMNIFNKVMRVETEVSSISAKIKEYGVLRDDIENITTRYAKLQSCTPQCGCCCATEEFNDCGDRLLELFEYLFSCGFDEAILHIVSF